MLSFLKNLVYEPYPLRSFALRLRQKLNRGSYVERLRDGIVERPHYGYCLFQGARLAKKLGIERISVLEFGVAGGRGLINLEYHAREIERVVGIEIEIYGFDTGRGLPMPVDYRDLPYQWDEGFFAMNEEELQSRLTKAVLVLGDIQESARTFFDRFEPAPVAAVMHDLDFYSATAAALGMFDAPEKYFLPRVFCFFDDIVGNETALYNDYTGERLAINEFNQAHETKKLSAAYHFLGHRIRETWHHQIFIYHDFGHSRYNDFVSDDNRQLPLPPA